MRIIGVRRLLIYLNKKRREDEREGDERSEGEKGMIRRKPLCPSRAEVFGFNRLSCGYYTGLVSASLGVDGDEVGCFVDEEGRFV